MMTEDLGSGPASDLELRLAALQAEFIRHSAYKRLQVLFDRHVQRRRAAQQLNLQGEARGIVVVGAPGSGKTTSVERLLSRYEDLAKPMPGVELAEVICLQIPSPATLKHVGAAMLGALGYPLQRDRPAAFIWDQVRSLLQRRGTLFVHLDEAQDLHTTKSQSAKSDVVNTLKSLMNNRTWPIGLILSGTPELIELVNSDHQLARRVDVINLDTVSCVTDAGKVRSILIKYCEKAGVGPADTILEDEFVSRIIHAGANEFGLIVQTIVAGIEEALVSDQQVVGQEHFATAFHRKSACIPAFNPFLAEDFLSIDPRKVLPMAMSVEARFAR